MLTVTELELDIDLPGLGPGIEEQPICGAGLVGAHGSSPWTEGPPAKTAQTETAPAK
jgi:hypothetical protein